ncbi:MAG: hypothetical protein ABEI74_00985, partial [Candidatus Pacearchaeota archaeon]
IETSERRQWASKEEAPIIKTHKFKAKELRKHWRFATKEEFNQKKEKFGYPEYYNEFFRKRPHLINQKFIFCKL